MISVNTMTTTKFYMQPTAIVTGSITAFADINFLPCTEAQYRISGLIKSLIEQDPGQMTIRTVIMGRRFSPHPANV